MTGALLYQPNPRWPIGTALCAATLLHVGALAFANIPQQDRIDDVRLSLGNPEVTIEPASPLDDPAPPLDPVAPTPSQDVADKSFIDANPTPPPNRRQENRLVAPLVKTKNTTSGSLSFSSAKIVALSAPRPEYPYEARRQRITGTGIVAMTVDPVSGRVTEASMWQSTGNPYLDNAAITGFRRWRFKPGTASRIKSPITYTLMGAAY